MGVRWVAFGRWLIGGSLLAMVIPVGAVPAAAGAAGGGGFAAQGEIPQVKLTASDGAAEARFGRSVAVSGDTAVVGAILADVNGNRAQGAAYVFTRAGEGWIERQKLLASDGAAFQRFGGSLAIDGDTLLVGAWARAPNGELSTSSSATAAAPGPSRRS